MSTMAPEITSLTIVCSTVYSDADQRKHQSSASLAFVWGIHRWPVNSPHKGPVTRKVFPFDDVIMPNINHAINASTPRSTSLVWICVKYVYTNWYVHMYSTDWDTAGYARMPPYTIKVYTTLNYLRAKFCRGNINTYLHFMSLLHIDRIQVLKILPQVREGPTYST